MLNDILLKSDNEYTHLNEKIALLPGSFKPPHKGHWEMVLNALKIVDVVHVFISNISETVILNRPLSKSRFYKIINLLKKYESHDDNINQLINDIQNSYLNISYNDLKIKLEDLISLTNDDKEFNQSLQTLINNLNKDLFKSIRYTSNNTCIEPIDSENIFKIYIKEYDLNEKVITHICNNPQPIMSAIGFANHQCKNCDIYIGSLTYDEFNERDSEWNNIIKLCKHNETNKIFRLSPAEKIQAARDIRKNINNLTKDMFPKKISNEAFEEIKMILNKNQIEETRKNLSSFNLVYESIMRSLISESGIAITGIQPVKLKNIEPTIKKLYDEILKPIGIKYESIILLGSTGKKDESGDLDIGINAIEAMSDSNSKDKFEIADKIEQECKKYGYQFANALNSQFKTIHVGIPIVNQDGIAQVDIMLTNNIEYAKFRFHSPTKDESKYKGSLRSSLLKILFLICSKAIDENANDDDKAEFIDKDGNKHDSVQYSHLSLDIDGLLKTIKTHRGKTGKLLSTPRTLSKSNLDVQNVQEMIDLLFNGLYKESDFNSFESIWNNVLFDSKFPYKDKIDIIVKTFINTFNRENSWQLEKNKLKLPDEVIKYANEHGITTVENI